MPHAGGGYEDTSHAHEWQVTYSYDSTGHWQKCEHCSKTTEKQSHEFNQGTCTVCGYVNEALLPPQKGLMSKYFSGVKATYAKEGIKDSDGTVKEFKDLVDRQIDVLAQDILTRLDYVYGNLRNYEWAWGSSFELRELDDMDAYKYYDSATGLNRVAKVYTENTLSQLSDEEYDALYGGTATLAEVNIDDLSDYQKSLLIKDTENNILASTILFNLIGASSGQTMKVVTVGRYDVLKLDKTKKWEMPELDTVAAKESLKLMIAQELSGSESVNYEYLTKKINTLGYPADFNKKLEDIINNKIIGAARITEDNGYYDILKKDYNGIINVANVKAIDGDTSYTETNSPRLYKGYKVIVSALVNSALENKFGIANVSLYPEFSNTAVDYTSNAAGFNEAHAYETLTLLAKEGTPYTKLVVKIKGADIGSSESSLSYEVRVNNTVIEDNYVNLTDEEQTVTIYVSRFESNKPFGAYSGNVLPDINKNIFENSLVNDYDDYNYIKITFTNDSGAKFTVTFDGYYDKRA